jgi:macrolide transport system ATP-binding/permease protein
MRKLLRRLQYWAGSRRRAAELAEEMEFHRAMSEEPGGAGRRSMGNMTLASEDARGVWIFPWIESFWQDLAYGIRGMRRQPGFTLVALATLGSTIGINTSLFTAFNAIAKRPLPVKEPARVVNIFRMSAGNTGGFSIAQYRYLAEHSKSFSGIVATAFGDPAGVEGHKVNSYYVSGNYFRALGVPMQLGRGFIDEEDVAGKPEPVVVIAYSVWQDWFGADPQLVGKQVRFGGVPFTVAGIASQDFRGTVGGPTDAWFPLAAKQLLRPNDPTVMQFLTSPSHCCSDMTGRLAPGVSRESARAETEVLLRQFSREFAASNPGPFGANTTRTLFTGTAWLDNPGRKGKALPVFALMFLAATLVVLLACANVGNLLLARAAARRHEMGVRLSLGGSRPRLIRQLLIESLTLAMAGAAIGLAIARVLPAFIVSRIAGTTMFRITPDFTVLAYTILLAALACLAFGLAPALHATRGDISGALKQDSVLPGVRLSLRSLLLFVQVAISVLLLTGAGMLVRGVQAARSADPGFTIDEVTAIAIEMPASAYGGDRTKVFARQLAAGLAAVPDMPPWGLSMDAPLSNGKTVTVYHTDRDKQDRQALIHEVSSGYFDVLQIPIVAGRNFTVDDSPRQSILINETMAKQAWPGVNAVGQTAVVNRVPLQIVGLVRDVYTTQLGSIEPTVYWPMDGFWMPQVLVRGGGKRAVQEVQAVVKGLEPRAQVRWMALAENLRAQTQASMVGAALAGAVGILALAMAAVGMSGVFAYAVRQRTREIGIRIALGAQQSSLVRLVLGSSLRAVAAGLLTGLLLAAGVARLLAHQFYGVRPFDVPAYAGVVLLLGFTALAATAGPARRAARLDAMNALRQD